jgi:phenylacetate-CoA ligase
LFNPYYALIRFGTGDLSAWHVDLCSCRLSTPRLVGWLGRIGDAVKVRGMFLHPRQANALLAQFPTVERFQFVITRADHIDHLTLRVKLAPDAEDPTVELTAAIRDGLKFKARIEITDNLPEGASVLDDQRKWDDLTAKNT